MILLGLILGLLGGFYTKAIFVVLKRIEARLALLNNPKETKPDSSASFAEPYTRAEAIAQMEQERVEALNE